MSQTTLIFERGVEATHKGIRGHGLVAFDYFKPQEIILN